MKHIIDQNTHTEWLCGDALSPWCCGDIGCPFILSRNEEHPEIAPETLIILQDYGCHSEEKNTLIKTANKLTPFFDKHTEPREYILEDTTLRKLFESVSEKTQTGEIAITNAVWALRNNQSKTGYLGSEIHKKWYENWLQVVQGFIDNKGKRIILCGEWARFENNRENQKIRDGKAYIEQWARWAKFNDINLGKNDFEVWLVRHPSAPSSQNSVWLSTEDGEIDFIDQGDLSKIVN